MALSLNISLSHAATISNNDYYQTGWAFYRAGQTAEAAKTWQALASSSEQQSDEQKKQAALSAAFATVLWQNLENPQAYTTWSDAIRLYLEANSSWEQERVMLKQRIATVRQALQQLIGDVVPTIEPFMSVLLEMDSRYGLTEFQTPKSGLKLTNSDSLLELNQNFLASLPVVMSEENQSLTTTVNSSSSEIQPASPQGESNNEQTVQTLTNQQHFAVDTQSDTVKPTNDQQDKSDKEQANNENNTQTLPVEAEIELATPERGHLIKPEETNVNEVNVKGTAFQRHVTPILEE
ncbi:MAG: hypothetical protein U1E99_03175 [Agitococcus sp.]